ncbi:MAG TPA: hypothetical protein VIM37_01420 [Candidatus Microsaccharimonas sp.]|jgi:hypothetical protein
MDDKEILAMGNVNEALKNLSEEERYRVIQWLANKYYSPTMPPVKAAGPSPLNPVQEIESGDVDEKTIDEPTTSDYGTFAEILDASGAKIEADMFLVAAYWLQIVGSAEKWKSFEVNKLLKDTGNEIKKISNPIRALEARKPKPIIQVSQAASASKRGSKEFKMTTEGVKTVETMLKAK